jgi:hypothetical protein
VNTPSNASFTRYLAVCLPLLALPHVDNGATTYEPVESVTFSTTVSGHKIDVLLSSKAFNAKAHQIAVPEHGGRVRIDGKLPIGTDFTADARTEFKQFEAR